ncbi:MAG: fibro-slime domain-containing protein [Deltaproteobacteria bacterium]|nr:fibro-slime domain-containing protein [Deltaproteobacteria bacterium]
MLCVFAGCSFDPGPGAQGSAGTGSTSGGGPMAGMRGTIGAGGQGGSATGTPPPVPITPADIGGYGLGAAVSGSGMSGGGIVAGSAGCNTIVGILRDFQGQDVSGGHGDFQAFSGNKETKGLVTAQLSANQKPIYASVCESGTQDKTACPYGQMSTSQANYDQWYSNVEGVNKPYLVYFQFAPNGGASTFSSSNFFPLDGTGWGNSGTGGKDDKAHNFHFTTEVHTTFKYNGGEHFTFVGDDDLWVFINGKLAMDLGGVHPQVTGTVDLDASAAALGIAPGNNYPMALFHAERHTSQSNFRVDTNLVFVNCGIIIP